MNKSDKDIIKSLIATWKERAKDCRIDGDQSTSPLVMLDKIHQAQQIESCIDELYAFTLFKGESSL